MTRTAGPDECLAVHAITGSCRCPAPRIVIMAGTVIGDKKVRVLGACETRIGAHAGVPAGHSFVVICLEAAGSGTPSGAKVIAASL